MEDHSSHHHQLERKDNSKEYLKFAGIMVAILAVSYLRGSLDDFTFREYVESFTGVFFVVFAGFKLLNLKEFAYGFQSYDLIAKKSLIYGYAYPFMQLIFGYLYLFGATNPVVDFVVLIVSLVSGVGVIKTLRSGTKVHCVCLGNVVKLPLSTISFVEDFGMAIMAMLMLVL